MVWLLIDTKTHPHTHTLEKTTIDSTTLTSTFTDLMILKSLIFVAPSSFPHIPAMTFNLLCPLELVALLFLTCAAYEIPPLSYLPRLTPPPSITSHLIDRAGSWCARADDWCHPDIWAWHWKWGHLKEALVKIRMTVGAWTYRLLKGLSGALRITASRMRVFVCVSLCECLCRSEWQQKGGEESRLNRLKKSELLLTLQILTFACANSVCSYH